MAPDEGQIQQHAGRWWRRVRSRRDDPGPESRQDRLARLEAKYLKVRIQNERETGFWRLGYRAFLATLAIAAFGWVAWPGLRDLFVAQVDRVAVITVSGEVSTTAWASAANLVPQIDRACASSGVKALVLEISSGGGSPTEADRVADALDRCREKTAKPIHAVVESNAHSAAYLIAAHADTITAARFASVGSIGTFQQWIDFSEAAERWGIRATRVRSGALKGGVGQLGSLTPDELDVVQERIDDYARTFLDRVRAGRGDRLVASDEVLMTGRAWTARQGLELGLVDRLGTLADVSRGELAGLRLQTNRPRLLEHPGGDVIDKILKLLPFLQNGPDKERRINEEAP